VALVATVVATITTLPLTDRNFPTESDRPSATLRVLGVEL
jgi:hypothetical protein